MTKGAKRLYSKPDDDGVANPDPTMRKPQGNPKGENMPPAGGEAMSPADSRDAVPSENQQSDPSAKDR